jgi:hypothetical protein
MATTSSSAASSCGSSSTPTEMAQKERGPFFVDASGGGLAALAAGVARSLGHRSAVAATSIDTIAVPPVVGVVLQEIGAELPDVILAASLTAEDAPHIDPSRFSLALYEGQGELERLATARIARDRIERHIELEGARS